MLFSDDELIAKLSRDIDVERDYGYDYNYAFCDIYPLLRQAAVRIEQLQAEVADTKAWALELRRKRWDAEARCARLEESKLRISKVLSNSCPQGTPRHG
jgi:hypothetical protein